MANDMRTSESAFRSIGSQAPELLQDAGAVQTLTDTYKLLSWTILFSAAMAWLSYAVITPAFPALVTNIFFVLGGYFALLFMVSRNAENPSGILWTFALTGWLGMTLGPLLYVATQVNGFAPVVSALATTGGIFLVTSWLGKKSAYALRFTRFLMAGILVAFVASLVNYFFLQMPTVSIVIAGAFALLSAGLISWQTAAIVHGGERNYIRATVTLFVALYNLFSILLSLFANRE